MCIRDRTRTRWNCTSGSGAKVGYRIRMRGWKRVGLSTRIMSASESACYGRGGHLAQSKTSCTRPSASKIGDRPNGSC
eukprot:8963642-Prorocentrum_lima.AAC.1